jgi:hypothetical protein
MSDMDGINGMNESGQRAADYEYDEAHDAVTVEEPPRRLPVQPAAGVPPTADTTGDLGYDLAHDVPPA